jgi:hypothetical protein
MPERKNRNLPILRIKKGDTVKAIHAKARRALTAADLQKYAEVEKGIPAEQILAELETLDQQQSLKRKQKSKNVRSR